MIILDWAKKVCAMYSDESCKVDSRITARLVNAVYMVCKDHNIILNNILVFPNLYNGFVKIGPYLNIIRILEIHMEQPRPSWAHQIFHTSQNKKFDSN